MFSVVVNNNVEVIERRRCLRLRGEVVIRLNTFRYNKKMHPGSSRVLSGLRAALQK